MRKLALLGVAVGLVTVALIAAGINVAWPKLSAFFAVEVSLAHPCETDAECDDGDACTIDWCQNGVFKACQHSQLPCDDGVACTSDSCDSAVGCIYVPSDATCDDGQFCTLDNCDPLHGCENIDDSTVCDDSNFCTTDTCNEAVDSCANSPAADGTPCDDGEPATTGDVCIAGVCTGVPPCGNGTLDPGEQCDDGNLIDGDGCSSTCQLEPSPTPTPTPSPTPSPTPTVGPTRSLFWGPGWHNVTWTGASTPEQAFACAAGNYAAAYRLVGGGWERYFPNRPDLSNMIDLAQYDAFLILVTDDVICQMGVADPPAAERTLNWGVGWQIDGWTGADGMPPEDVFDCAEDSYAAAYRLVGGGWERYFPDRPEISNMGPLDEYDAFLILVTGPVSCTMAIAP
jgi:cysteine-rich repeat protein